MKKPKHTPIKIEPAKAETVKIIAARPSVAPEPASAVSRPGRVSFEFVKADAKSVCVAGSFNNWKPEMAPLAPSGNGRWAGDLTIKPGRHEYLFVVDGQWIPDPNAKESVQNPFGGRNSILGVSE
jgi:1,4-alpha-glucan branching enzyme